MTYYLGVDLGGSQMRIAAVNEAGDLASQMYSVPTGKEFSPENFRANILHLVANVKAEIGEQEFTGLGIGTTGLVGEQGIIQADFLPLLSNINMVQIVQEILPISVKVENDARCFVLAEARFGAGLGCTNVVGITLGTGVGGGVMLDGKLLHGANNYAGEFWGIPLRGKWMEYFVSGIGIVQTFQEKGGATDNVSAEKIAELARTGNSIAIQTYESFAADLWALCETVRSLLDPEVVVIGGSIAQSRDVFEDYLQRKLNERGPKIAWAKLGNAAGVVGAASLNMKF